MAREWFVMACAPIQRVPCGTGRRHDCLQTAMRIELSIASERPSLMSAWSAEVRQPADDGLGAPDVISSPADGVMLGSLPLEVSRRAELRLSAAGQDGGRTPVEAKQGGHN